jgi:hypothetical protein
VVIHDFKVAPPTRLPLKRLFIGQAILDSASQSRGNLTEQAVPSQTALAFVSAARWTIKKSAMFSRRLTPLIRLPSCHARGVGIHARQPRRFSRQTWTIPGSGTKGKRDHAVSMTPAIAVLFSRREGTVVMPSGLLTR